MQTVSHCQTIISSMSYICFVQLAMKRIRAPEILFPWRDGPFNRELKEAEKQVCERGRKQRGVYHIQHSPKARNEDP